MSVCPCNNIVLSDCLGIQPGLAKIPRQFLSFGDYRNRMISAIAGKPALAGWSGEAELDLGVMLIEMWAYVLDVSQFYDSAISNETYLLTCKRELSARRLVGLLGYKPRPALSTIVTLAAEADGNDIVTLPIGTGFRSEAFDGEPPQISELITEHVIRPEYNFWDLTPFPDTVYPGRLLFNPRGSGVPRSGVLVIMEGSPHAILLTGHIENSSPYIGRDDRRYQQVDLDEALPGSPAKSLADLTVRLLGLSAGKSLYATTITDDKIVLDGIYPQIKSGDPAALEIDGDLHGFIVQSTEKADVTVFVTPDTSVADIMAPATKIGLPATIAALLDDATEFTVHFHPIRVGKLVAPAKTFISLDDFAATPVLETPPRELSDLPSPANFIVKGEKNLGASLAGSVSVNEANRDYEFVLGTGNPAFSSELNAPLKLFGNVLTAVRGERVQGETLGSADASAPNNRFKLKKQPLSWIEDSSAANGARPLLEVLVNSVRWHRVETLFNAQPDDQVYVTEIDDKGDTWIVFGDGLRGDRPATGIQNVLATYSFGAGAAKPPPGSVKQIAKKVKGLKKVINPVLAKSGRDPETATDFKSNGPAAALTLGRAVSVQDFEALARSYSGVQNTSAGWSWDARRQRAVVIISIVDAGDVDTQELQNWLANMAAQNTPITVRRATPISSRLSVSLNIHPDHSRDLTIDEVKRVLTYPEFGFLSKRRVPIGGVIYRSAIVKTVHSVEGVAAVSALRLNDAEMDWAINASDGTYFDFTETDAVMVE